MSEAFGVGASHRAQLKLLDEGKPLTDEGVGALRR